MRHMQGDKREHTKMKARSDECIRIFGKQPVSEALSARWPVRELLIRGEPRDTFTRNLIELAASQGIQITFLEQTVFDRRFARSSQGVAALVQGVRYLELNEALGMVPPGESPLFVALDGIEDPHNLGAISRTALAIGAHAVIVPRRRTAGLGEGAAKSSAGAVFRQPLCQVPNINYFIQWAKDNGLWVFGLDGHGEKTTWDVDLTCGVVLVVGGEGRGLSRLTRERCDCLVRIPMSGAIGSLNASVACGMALYEVMRQRAW